MTEDHEVWVKLSDKRERDRTHFSFKPLAIIFAFLVGWVALVVVLRTVMPVSDGVRVGAYFVYCLIAAIVVGRSIRKTRSSS